MGKMNLTWGIWEARCSATSLKPSEESPRPWQIIMVALWREGLLGVTVMVPSPCRVVVDAIVDNTYYVLWSVGCWLCESWILDLCGKKNDGGNPSVF